MARLILDLYQDWCHLDERIDAVIGEIEELSQVEAKCQRLMSVPGIGPVISTGLVAAIGRMGSVVLAHAGDSRRAIDYAERSLRITPFGRDSALPYVGMAMAHLSAGDFPAAADASAKAVQANSRFSLSHALQAAALVRLDRLDQAKAAAARVLECEPDFTIEKFVRSHTGRADIWDLIGDALRRLALPDG
jgi:tetratricopeptide (TPR) repeat protein